MLCIFIRLALNNCVIVLSISHCTLHWIDDDGCGISIEAKEVRLSKNRELWCNKDVSLVHVYLDQKSCEFKYFFVVKMTLVENRTRLTTVA